MHAVDDRPDGDTAASTAGLEASRPSVSELIQRVLDAEEQEQPDPKTLRRGAAAAAALAGIAAELGRRDATGCTARPVPDGGSRYLFARALPSLR